MSEIKSFSDYADKYNTNRDYSYLFSGMESKNSTTSGNSILADHASLKNGSYKKLLKAYYANQDVEKTSSGKDTEKKSLLISNSADMLKEAADGLNKAYLWQKKKITTKNEETGEETESKNYDWDAITKAVQSFVDNYNDTLERAGDSDVKNVLRDTLSMVKNMSKNKGLLSKAGIKIAKDNKLELDGEKLKTADIGVLKTLFLGNNSPINRVSQKAGSISLAATRGVATYTSKGTYSKALSQITSGKIDKEV